VDDADACKMVRRCLSHERHVYMYSSRNLSCRRFSLFGQTWECPLERSQRSKFCSSPSSFELKKKANFLQMLVSCLSKYCVSSFSCPPGMRRWHATRRYGPRIQLYVLKISCNCFLNEYPAQMLRQWERAGFVLSSSRQISR